MNLSDINKIKESIQKNTLLLSSAASQTSNNNNNTNNIKQQQQQQQLNATSPSELPPPSPASSIGSSASSMAGNNNNQQTTSSSSANLQGLNEPSSASNTNSNTNLELMQKILNLHERFLRYNDFILRSQNIWDQTEQLINENDNLNGYFIFKKI
jgi:hypothetical protein